MKRNSLLLVLGLMVFGSMNAFACQHCFVEHDPPYEAICVTRTFGGFYCDFPSPVDCVEVGDCSPQALPAETSQWTIASVERLDGQRTITATSPMKSAQLAPKAVRQH